MEGILGDYPIFNVYGLRDTRVCLWWGVCVSSAKYCFSGQEIGGTNHGGIFFDGIHGLQCVIGSLVREYGIL